MMWMVFMVVVVTLLFYLGVCKPRGYPPGPPGLPLVGHLLLLDKHSPYKHLWRLSDTYGPVLGLYFANRPVVVTHGWEAVKEALMNEDLIGRPQIPITKLLYNGYRGVLFVEGELWKEQRRFALHHFRNLGFGKKSHEAVIHEEAEELVKEILGSKCSVHLQSALGVSLVNILWAIMGGTRLSRQDPKLRFLVDRLNLFFRVGDVTGGLINTFPFLRHLQSKDSKFNTVLSGFSLIREFIMKAIDEHKATLDPDNPRDFIDIYLNEINKQDKNPDTTFSDDQLLAVCVDVFSAGVETSSSTVSFALLMVILHPHVAETIYKELDEVVGRNRLPSLDDKHKLVYINATMNEVFRFRGPVPLGVFHKAIRDTTLQGHRIAVNTRVLTNLYSVHMDPHYWGDPQVFRPERFINPDGSLRKEERLIPFGKGRRVCLGESLARMTTFLLFSALMQHLRFKLDPAIPVTDTEGKSGLTLSPPQYKVFAEARF